MIDDIFYAEASDFPSKALVWVGSWFEAMGAVCMVIATWFYHRAGAHGHCARQDLMAEQANTALEDYVRWQELRKRYRDARNN